MMTREEALQLIEATLEFKTGKQLTYPEKEILKAAWDNETYSNVAESLYLSLGYIKNLAALLWQRLSDVFGQKIGKNNFRWVMEEQNTNPHYFEETRAENELDCNEDSQGNILIVDDPSSSLKFLTTALSRRGYNVRSVTNSKMAFRTIRNNSPDIILMYIKMPDMDGYEVCQALKSDEITAEIPIIFLSALNEPIDKIKAFRVGGVDCIPQSLEAEEVIARIQAQLMIQQQKHQLRQQMEYHQQTAEVLYQSRAVLASLLNSSKDGIAALEVVRDALTEEINDFRCLVVNPVFAKLLGQKRESLMGKTIPQKSIERLSPTLFESLVEVVETGEEIEKEFYWEDDSQQVWYCLNAVKFGEGCSITVRNITNFKLLELKMKVVVYLQQIASE